LSDKAETNLTWGLQKPATGKCVIGMTSDLRTMEILPENIYSRWEQERIENIHDKEAIAEKYGWKMVDTLTEMEIDQRNRELLEGKRQSFFNSEQERRVNRWLKKLLSCADPEARVVQLLKKTP